MREDMEFLKRENEMLREQLKFYKELALNSVELNKKAKERIKNLKQEKLNILEDKNFTQTIFNTFA